MFKYILYLFIIILYSQFMHCSSFSINIKNNNIFNNSIPIITNVNQNNIMNLFDNNTSNYIILDKSVFGTNRDPFIELIFKNIITVDEIIIKHYYLSNLNYYANINKGYIDIYNSQTKSIKSVVINIASNNTYHKILLEKPIVADTWTFSIYSTYPGEKSDDICISEIEFWYKGEKYKIANLEQAKRDYIIARKEYNRKILLGSFIAAADTYFLNKQKELRERLKKLGLDIPGLDPMEDRSKATLYMQFTWTKEWAGEIFAQSKAYDLIDDGNTYKLSKPYKIGEWKIDEYGNIWVKIGTGDWKMETAHGFVGTDLEKVNNAVPVLR